MNTTPKPRKCRVCPTRFTPMRPFQTWCSVPCGSVLAEQKLAKKKKADAVADRKATKAALEKFKSIADLIAEAQVYFNKFIRLRDKDKGCFVCGRPFEDKPGRVQHAGHVRSRGAAGHLRFNEDNCHGECEGCNGPHGAKPHEIKAGAIARIGQARYDALEADNEPHKWEREELIAIKTTYAQKVRAIEKERV